MIKKLSLVAVLLVAMLGLTGCFIGDTVALDDRGYLRGVFDASGYLDKSLYTTSEPVVLDMATLVSDTKIDLSKYEGFFEVSLSERKMDYKLIESPKIVDGHITYTAPKAGRYEIIFSTKLQGEGYVVAYFEVK